MEDALDQRQRAQHLATARRPDAGRRRDGRHGHLRRADRAHRGPERRQPRSPRCSSSSARTRRSIRTGPTGRRGDPQRPDEVPRSAQRRGDRADHDQGERAGDPAEVPVQVVRRPATGRPWLGARRADPLDHAPGQGLRRDRAENGEAPRRPSRARPPQRAAARAAERTSPRSSSTACCRGRCRRSRASRPPRASWPPARPTRSAATSTTSSAAVGNWTAVIGDVCGKGPEAASLTALARYTVRTASSPGELAERGAADPARLDQLGALRLPLLHRRSGANPGAVERDGEAHLTVALGGHPLPMILRKNGKVDPIGRPGTLLGVLPSPVLADADATLGRRRLADPLHGRRPGRPGSRRAGRPGLARQADRRVRGQERGRDRGGARQAAIKRHGGEPRDDIAILVLHRSGD